MATARLEALNLRSDVHLDFSPRRGCRMQDSMEVDYAIATQLFGSDDEEDTFEACELTQWRLRWYV